MKTRFVKEQGVIKWLGQPIELMFNLIANGEYTLEIKKKVKKRTVDQNALMWMWLTCIEDETGTLNKMYMNITVKSSFGEMYSLMVKRKLSSGLHRNLIRLK